MFQEPLEDRYNDLLKQRVALKGELASVRKQADENLSKARTKNRRYVLLLFLVPFLTFWCSKKRYIQPLEQTTMRQHDSILTLQNDVILAKRGLKTRVRHIAYS